MDDTNNSREAQGLSRSLILRKNSEWLPEPAMRLRKAYFCTDKTGYLRKKAEHSECRSYDDLYSNWKRLLGFHHRLSSIPTWI